MAFVLRQDQSSHWYVVPFERVEEWERWTELDEDSEAAWDAPEWATELGCSPQTLVFTGAWKRS